MSKFVELRQRPDDSWQIEVPRESGIVEVVELPKLSKEQAQDEAHRRGYSHVRSWDKHVLKALADGKVDLKRSRIE